jgi:hypothetical protein
MELQPNLPQGGLWKQHPRFKFTKLQVGNRNVRLSVTCLVTTLHSNHNLTRTRPITVSTFVVPSQLHLIYVVDLSLMIKQIAIISGRCLALRWVRTHKHVCVEALKPSHIIPTYEHLTFRLMIWEEKRLYSLPQWLVFFPITDKILRPPPLTQVISLHDHLHWEMRINTATNVKR